MAYCINCGQELVIGAKFCHNCGTAVHTPKTEESDVSKRKIVYDGEIHKCPNCGEQLTAFVTSCPTCGYELRGPKVTSAVKELAQKLENSESIERKVDLIRNFYIPNTKEDIYEFIILAVSNMRAGAYDVDAWGAKLEQAYQKAKLSFGNTLEFQYLDQLYNKAKKQQETHAFTRRIKKSKFLQCVLLLGVGLVLVIIGSFGGYLSGDPDSPFYMLALIGLYPILGAFFILVTDEKNRKN